MLVVCFTRVGKVNRNIIVFAIIIDLSTEAERNYGKGNFTSSNDKIWRLGH